MVQETSLLGLRVANGNAPDFSRLEALELKALQAENNQLKELVVQLSKIVIENVKDGGPSRKKLQQIADLATEQRLRDQSGLTAPWSSPQLIR